jgi:transposase
MEIGPSLRRPSVQAGFEGSQMIESNLRSPGKIADVASFVFVFQSVRGDPPHQRADGCHMSTDGKHILQTRSQNPDWGTIQTASDFARSEPASKRRVVVLAEGIVIDACMSRHRHQEWIKFLKHIDAATDPEAELHLVADNYATHKHPKVRRWLTRHPRFHMHFTPTSSSWLNLVERWFRDLTQKRLRRGTFKSVRQLQQAIFEYVELHNNQAEGYHWQAMPEEILVKVRRARAVLDKTPIA